MSGEYVLTQDWGGEGERLALLEAMVDGLCARALTAAGIAPGAACLEVGAGSGSVARWMAEQVGDPGRVWATDLDLGLLGPLADAGIRVLRHDARTDGYPADAPRQGFDVVHSRAVLEHLPEREDVLDRLGPWLAPDGVLVVTDCVAFPIASSPHPAYREAMQAWIDVLGITGTDYAWARAFPDPLVDRGYRDVGVAWLVPPVVGGGPVARFWALTLERLVPRIVEADLADAATMAEAGRLLADPAFHDLAPAFVAMWGRRPADGP